MSKRSIPDWLKRNSLDIPQTSDENSDSNNAETSRPRRRLRSNFSFDDKTKQVAEAPMLKPIDYPAIEYTGKIHYHTDMMDIAFASDKLLQV